MKVEVKLFGHFRSYLPPDANGGKVVVELPEGANSIQLTEALGIPFEIDEGTFVTVVNDEEVLIDAPLKDGDQVSIFPPLPGG